MCKILIVFVGVLLSLGQTCGAWVEPSYHFEEAIGGSMDMAFDANGNAIAVIDNNGSIEAYYYSREQNTWSGPKKLGPSNDYARVSVAMDQSGTAIAIWVDKIDNPPIGPLIHIAYFDGTAWSRGPNLLTGYEIGSFALKMNGPNSALAVFINDKKKVFCSFINSGKWGKINHIAESDGDQLSVAYSPNGTAVIGFVNDYLGRVVNYIDGTWVRLSF